MNIDTRFQTKPLTFLRSEMACWVGLFTVLLMFTVGSNWLDDLSNPIWFLILFLGLSAAILWAAFGVTRHADCLAIMLGEPYGTLLLTVAVTGMEVVMIVAVAFSGSGAPTVARDTMFSVVMIQLNGLVGLALLIGGLTHREQYFNIQGNTSFLAVITALSGLTLILPKLMPVPPWFLIAATIVLYGTFLGIQTMRHQGYFKFAETEGDDAVDHGHHGLILRPKPYHVALLLLTMLSVVLLAKKFAVLIDHGVNQMGAPVAMGGLLIAVLVLSPEVMSAIKAAGENRMQRSDNIILGATLATIGLTVPGVTIASLMTGNAVKLGLDDVGILLLSLTLLISLINASTGRTNILQGLIHLTLFAAFLLTVFV
ncbi:calcium:proton antiporter [Roseibium sp. SCPC15]|uniref:calcium:proton antiporter n=1 Tax=Roseibium sp. SCP15 TaxID=3141376 RepID=UPI003334C899